MDQHLIFTCSKLYDMFSSDVILEATQPAGTKGLITHTDELTSRFVTAGTTILTVIFDCNAQHEFSTASLDICKTYRSNGNKVCLIGVLDVARLSKTEIESKLDSLGYIFDDIVLTPLRQNELLIRALRLIRLAIKSDRRKTDGLVIGPLEFDLKMMSASANGQPIRLTKKETELLLYMAYRSERVIDRVELVRDVWHVKQYSESIESVLNGHLSRIRDKLGRVGCRGILKTVRGVGLILSISGYKAHWDKANANASTLSALNQQKSEFA